MSSEFDASVIIPTYNSEKFVSRAVNSVLEQARVNVQLIVVDDEGNDRTREILETIKKDNPERAILLEYRGSALGQATARNRGIELARGRYVALLDSDDTFAHANVLAHWVGFADRLELEMAGGQYDFVNDKGDVIASRSVRPTGEQAVSVLTEPQLVTATSCWQFIYRNAFLSERGIAFSRNLRQREDRLFLVEAMLKASRIGVLGDTVIHHYAREGSSFTQIDREQFQQYIQHVTELNASIANARAVNCLSVEFETANSSIYFNSLYKYWRRLLLELMAAPDAQDLIAAYKRQFKMLGGTATPYFDCALINDTDLADPPIAEATIDVLRLAILQDNEGIIAKLLENKRLALSELRPLVNDLPSEKIVCRYLSFTRDKRIDGVAAPQRTLAQLVSRVVFHVGAPKTGTSALQHTLECNRLRLIAEGVHYPVTGTYREMDIRRERSSGHARLMTGLLAADKSILNDLCAEIEDLGQPIHTLVLSSENILSPRFWSGGADFRAIVERFGVENVEVVAVFRRQDDWIRSLYIEQTSNPWNKFTDSFANLVDSYDRLGLFDYEALLETLASAKGVSAVHVGAYEDIREKGGITEWFTRVANFPSIELMPITAEQSNPSFSEAQAALIKLAKANPTLSRADLTMAFKLAVKHFNVDCENVLISERDLDNFGIKFAPFISAYCKRFGFPEKPVRPVLEANGPPSITLPKELFDLLVLSRPQQRRPTRPRKKASRQNKAMISAARRKHFAQPVTGKSGRRFNLSLVRNFAPHNFGEMRDAFLIWRSGLFDPVYYLSANSDVASSGMNPLIHYVRHGAFEGRRPSRDLDVTLFWDIEADPFDEDFGGKRSNPLIQYLSKFGH